MFSLCPNFSVCSCHVCVEPVELVFHLAGGIFLLPKCMPLIPSSLYPGVYAHVDTLLPCIVLSFLISYLVLVE